MEDCIWLSIDYDCMLTYDEKLNAKKCNSCENCKDYEEVSYD